MNMPDGRVPASHLNENWSKWSRLEEVTQYVVDRGCELQLRPGEFVIIARERGLRAEEMLSVSQLESIGYLRLFQEACHRARVRVSKAYVEPEESA